MMTEPGCLDAVHVAVGRGDWQHALELLDARAPEAASAAGLELRARAAYGNGDLEDAVAAWEGLYALRLAEGDEIDAARAAAMLAMFLLIDTGLMAPVRGWVRRAETLLAGKPESPPNALVAMVRTYERFMCGDMDAVRRHAPVAVDLGQRLGVMPAMVLGRVAMARLMLLDGHLLEGLDQLDEIATLLMSGEVDPLTTGMMYCELICAAQGLGLHDRAVEWTDVMERWRHGNAFGAINGRCRVHRAELLRVSGPCDRAEAEAVLACEELRPWMRREFGWPLVELGNIRLRKGDLVGAEEAFLSAHERAWSAQPGLALLRLAQGDVAIAHAMIAEAVNHPADLPWKERPPSGDLRMAPLLDAQTEIAVAAGDLAMARLAADSLERIADQFASPSLRAAALLADARVRLASGDTERARAAATGAMVLWADLGAPFDAAVARTLLADARRRDGEPDAARLEWQSACQAFASFGAQGWAARCEEALAGLVEPTPGPARGHLVGVFRLEGDIRRVHLAGESTSMRDLQGLRYVERLLAAPGHEFHVLDLVAGEHRVDHERPTTRRGRRRKAGGERHPDAGRPRRSAYRRRLAEVDEDIEEATANNDIARRELAQRDREYLIAELRSAVGVGGRERTTGSSAERARTAVTRSIRYAIARVADHAPGVAGHLELRVRTGTYCSYLPDPISPIEWST